LVCLNNSLRFPILLCHLPLLLPSSPHCLPETLASSSTPI
jgi:hypothetical protein